MRKTFTVLFFLSLVFISSINPIQGSYRSEQIDKDTIPSGGGLFTEFKGEVLSVDIKDEPLKKVLEQLSNQIRITFLLPPSLEEEKVMMRFSNLKLDEGLSRILGPYNRIFIYRDNHNTLSESPVVRLTEVRIFPHVYEGRVKEPLMRISEGLPQSVGNTGKHTKKYEIARSDEKKEREPVGKRLSLASMGSDREEKLERIKSLAEGGTVEDIKALSVALRDKDPKVKEEAVNALKKMGSDITDEGKVDDVYDSAEGEGKEGAQPALTVASGPGTSAQINLTNDVPVRGVQFTLNGAQPTEVRTTSRTEGFFATHDKKSGKVILVSLSGKTIAPGTGPIAEVVGAYRGTAHQVSGVVIGK